MIIISLHHVPYDVVDCQCVPCTAKPHAALFVCHTGLRLCCCRPASPPESCGAFQRPKGVFVCQAPLRLKDLGFYRQEYMTAVEPDVTESGRSRWRLL